MVSNEHLERDAASSALHAHCELTDTTPRDCILGLSAAPPGLSTPEPGAAGPPEAVLPQVGTGSTIKGRVGRDSAISALLCPQAQAGSCSGVPAGCSGPLSPASLSQGTRCWLSSDPRHSRDPLPEVLLLLSSCGKGSPERLRDLPRSPVLRLSQVCPDFPGHQGSLGFGTIEVCDSPGCLLHSAWVPWAALL